MKQRDREVKQEMKRGDRERGGGQERKGAEQCAGQALGGVGSQVPKPDPLRFTVALALKMTLRMT